MTPSHHGLGSVVLCTVGGAHRGGGHAPRRRHRPGRPRSRRASSTWRRGLGLEADRVRARAAPADAGRARVARRREGVAAARHRGAHPAERRSPAPSRRATSRRWRRSTASGTWCSTCRPFTGGSAHAAERADAGRRRRSSRRRRPIAAGTRLARRAALGHLVVFSAETVAGRGAPAGLRAQRGAGRRGHLRPRDRRRSRWRRRTCAASATGAAGRSSSSTCRRG